MLAAKVILFTILAPGTVAAWLPYFIVSHADGLDALPLGPVRLVGVPLMLVGFAVYCRCAYDFAARGRGTPAPIDPPKLLVRAGLYRYSRNPMYVGILTIVLGEAIYWRSPSLLIYGAIVWLVFHTFIVFYEEPTLRRLFGDDYGEYLASAPRWIGRPSADR